MVFNVTFWEQFIRNQLVRQITIFVENIENRLLPTFDDIEKEAQKVEEQERERLCSSCSSPDIDPADLAEKAHDAGGEYYLMLSGVKQALLNISVTTLSHLFEQQILFFLRREVLHPSEENNLKLIRISVFKERLQNQGIDIGKFESWATIKQLSLVANAIKHAEGKSAIELRQIRPNLFKHPILREQEWGFRVNYRRLYMPLAGEDLYTALEDLKKYRDAIVKFWNELIYAMYENE